MNDPAIRAGEILAFWFGRPDEPGYLERREAWFKKDDAFDERIRAGFMADYERAAAGEYDMLTPAPLGALAVVILLDQFPRNMFRGTPRMYATDARALEIARAAIDQGLDARLSVVERTFFYLPFEHSEDIADQRRCAELAEAIEDHPDKEMLVEWSRRHLVIIERFGRFPHRNAILGRSSTPEELAFLDEPGSSF